MMASSPSPQTSSIGIWTRRMLNHLKVMLPAQTAITDVQVRTSRSRAVFGAHFRPEGLEAYRRHQRVMPCRNVDRTVAYLQEIGRLLIVQIAESALLRPASQTSKSGRDRLCLATVPRLSSSHERHDLHLIPFLQRRVVSVAADQSAV
jgi:hypothetical protein